MPLTQFQREVLAVIVGNRSVLSHFAGGLVLNAADDSARYSKDFDLFHAEIRDLDFNILARLKIGDSREPLVSEMGAIGVGSPALQGVLGRRR